jgi:hypothetical protein
MRFTGLIHFRIIYSTSSRIYAQRKRSLGVKGRQTETTHRKRTQREKKVEIPERT